MPRRGGPKSAATPLADSPTGPFGRSQTPQSGVCASPPKQAHGDKEISIGNVGVSIRRLTDDRIRPR